MGGAARNHGGTRGHGCSLVQGERPNINFHVLSDNILSKIVKSSKKGPVRNPSDKKIMCVKKLLKVQTDEKNQHEEEKLDNPTIRKQQDSRLMKPKDLGHNKGCKQKVFDEMVHRMMDIKDDEALHFMSEKNILENVVQSHNLQHVVDNKNPEQEKDEKNIEQVIGNKSLHQVLDGKALHQLVENKALQQVDYKAQKQVLDEEALQQAIDIKVLKQVTDKKDIQLWDNEIVMVESKNLQQEVKNPTLQQKLVNETIQQLKDVNLNYLVKEQVDDKTKKQVLEEKALQQVVKEKQVYDQQVLQNMVDNKAKQHEVNEETLEQVVEINIRQQMIDKEVEQVGDEEKEDSNSFQKVFKKLSQHNVANHQQQVDKKLFEHEEGNVQVCRVQKPAGKYPEPGNSGLHTPLSTQQKKTTGLQFGVLPVPQLQAQTAQVQTHKVLIESPLSPLRKQQPEIVEQFATSSMMHCASTDHQMQTMILLFVPSSSCFIHPIYNYLPYMGGNFLHHQFPRSYQLPNQAQD